MSEKSKHQVQDQDNNNTRGAALEGTGVEVGLFGPRDQPVTPGQHPPRSKAPEQACHQRQADAPMDEGDQATNMSVDRSRDRGKVEKACCVNPTSLSKVMTTCQDPMVKAACARKDDPTPLML